MFKKHKLFQFLRFCTVGLGNTAVDFSAFFILTLSGVPHLPAQVISYSAGLTNSYFFNKRWTFQAGSKVNAAELYRFVAINGLSLLVSTGVLFVLYDLQHFELLLCKIAATGGSVLINYIGSRIWVFTEHQPIGGEVI